jgi:hypothetical protein
MIYLCQRYKVECDNCRDISNTIFYRGFYSVGEKCNRCLIGTYQIKNIEEFKFNI